MTELLRVGFFREMPHGAPTDPSLAAARAEAPQPHQDRIADYLDSGYVFTATEAPTRDVFEPSKRIGPPHYLTDGRYLWPGDLAYYVRSYHVRLPTSFLAHMMANGWHVPSDVDLATLTRPSAAAVLTPAVERTPDLASALADLFGSVGAAASRFVQAVAPSDPGARERVDAEAEKLKAAVEHAGADAARAAEQLGEELRRAVDDASERARTRLSSTLRSVTEWLEKPPAERTAQVQQLLSRVESRIDELLAHRPADPAETGTPDERAGLDDDDKPAN